VHRQANRPSGVGDAAGNGLADPPGGVGRELEALAPVELLHRVHQTEVALLDEVEQGQTGRLVLLGNGDHQSKVGLDKVALGGVATVRGALQGQLLAGRNLDFLVGLGRVQLGLGLATFFDGLGQADFIVLGQKGILANVREIEPYQVLIITINAIFSHGLPFVILTRKIRYL
jgi:hypothetical protein